MAKRHFSIGFEGETQQEVIGEMVQYLQEVGILRNQNQNGPKAVKENEDKSDDA